MISPWEPVLLDETFADGAASDEVFLDDLFEDWRVALAVPRSFRIDHRNRPAFADSQAIRFRTQDTALLREAELLQPALQELPRRHSPLLLAAFGRRLLAAEKNVAPRHPDANRPRHLLLGVTHSNVYTRSVTETSSRPRRLRGVCPARPGFCGSERSSDTRRPG